MAKLVVGLDSSGSNWKSVMVSRGLSEKVRIEGYASFPPLPFPPSVLLSSSHEDERMTAAILEWAEQLRSALVPFKNGSRDVVVGIARDPVSLRVLDLPFAQAAKIAKVLPFEAESLLPFDSEDLLFDFYPLSQTEGKTKVLSAAMKRQELSALLDHLKLLDLDPAILTPASLAFHHLLALMPPQSEALAERAVFLDVGETSSQLAVVERARTIFAMSVSAGIYALVPGEGEEGREKMETAPDRLAAVLSTAIERTAHFLEGFASDDSGPPPLRRVIIIGEGANVPGLRDKLSAALDLPVEPFRLPEGAMAEDARVPEELHAKLAPALALALQKAYPEGRPGLNFRREEFAFRPESKLLVRKMILPGILVLLLLVTLGIRVSVSGSSEKQRSQAVKKEMESMFRKSFPGIPVQDPARQVKTMLDQVKAKQPDYVELGYPSALECLAEVSNAIPSSITVAITSFEYRNGRVSISGDADKLEDPNEIAKRLQQVPVFAKVDLSGATATQDQKVRFKISIDLKKEGAP